MLIVLHDVTRLRHLENVRRDFVANVSHELRTPITSIKGSWKRSWTRLDDRARHAFLGIVLRQVNRLDAIITDLIVAFRPVKVYSEDYAEQEYDATPDELQQVRASSQPGAGCGPKGPPAQAVYGNVKAWLNPPS